VGELQFAVKRQSVCRTEKALMSLFYGFAAEMFKQFWR